MTGIWGVELHSTQDVVTLTAALAGVAWVYLNLVRPFVRAMQHGVVIVVKTAQALGVLDDLPGWMVKHDADRAAIEAELGIVHARVTKIENVQSAMVRDLGVDVRSLEAQDSVDMEHDGPSESA